MFIYAHNRDSQTARFTMLFHGPENSKTAPPVGDPGPLYNKSGQAHLRPLPKWHHDQLNQFSRAHSCVHQTDTQTGKPCNTGYNRLYLALLVPRCGLKCKTRHEPDVKYCSNFSPVILPSSFRKTVLTKPSAARSRFSDLITARIDCR